MTDIYNCNCHLTLAYESEERVPDTTFFKTPIKQLMLWFDPSNWLPISPRFYLLPEWISS